MGPQHVCESDTAADHHDKKLDAELRVLRMTLTSLTTQYQDKVLHLINLHLSSGDDSATATGQLGASRARSDRGGVQRTTYHHPAQRPVAAEPSCFADAGSTAERQREQQQQQQQQQKRQEDAVGISSVEGRGPADGLKDERSQATPGLNLIDIDMPRRLDHQDAGVSPTRKSREVVQQDSGEESRITNSTGAAGQLEFAKDQENPTKPVMLSRKATCTTARSASSLPKRRASDMEPISKAGKQRRKEDQKCVQRVIASKPYELSVMLLVTFNAIFIGVQVQTYAADSAEQTSTTSTSVETLDTGPRRVDALFLFLFTVELLVRAMAYKSQFLCGPEWNWNVFDSVVVFVMWAEEVLNAISARGRVNPMLSQMSILRILRVTRIIRILRVIKVLKFFRELRLMLSSILNSTLSLFWAMCLLGMMFYIFGLSLTQGAVDYLNDTASWGDPSSRSLIEHFGTLDAAVLSLYEGMSGGISWGELANDLAPLPWNYFWLFIMFISLAILAVLNIVTGVFVQTAMERCQLDKETLIQDAMTNKERYLQKIHHIFRELDTNQSGTLTYEELEVAMEDERMGAYFDALGLDVEEVDMLFTLLDVDQEGAIDIDEFLNGCLKLKGEAKGLDMAIVQYQTKWLMHNVGVAVESLTLREHGLHSHGPHHFHGHGPQTALAPRASGETEAVLVPPPRLGNREACDRAVLPPIPAKQPCELRSMSSLRSCPTRSNAGVACGDVIVQMEPIQDPSMSREKRWSSL